MERSKIPMLSRFDSISHIMPYYGQTHWAFLLLAGLCSETRGKLDEFYDEFVTCMKENWTFAEVNQPNQSSYLFLPNDLFEVSVDCRNQERINWFIKFIQDLRDSKGWYFNSHYMHLKVKIRDPIRVEIDFIKELYPYVDSLKSTQVILCKKDIDTSKVEYESSTLDTNCSHALLLLKRTFLTCIMFIIFNFYKSLEDFLNLSFFLIESSPSLLMHQFRKLK